MKTIYFGGDILTMEGSGSTEALLAEDGIIRALGSREEIFNLKQADTRLVDLEGRTLMPSFIDPHSHIAAYSSTLRLVPLEGATCFEDIESRFLDYMAKQKLLPGQWISGFGYDNNTLPGKQHPTKELLDKISSDHPMVIAHASGHMGVANSAALKELGITENTPNPEGGVIGREPGTSVPNGYLEEVAFTCLKIPQPSLEEQCALLEQAQKTYFQYGITTAQEGIAKEPEWNVLQSAAEQGRLSMDIVSYVDLKDNRLVAAKHPEYVKQYRNRLKIGGYKLFLDGSPQGRTAWMTTPYFGGEPGYCGYPIYDTADVTAMMGTAIEDEMQLLVHCNGDAAAQQMIDAYSAALAGHPERKGIHPVMIHAQLVRRDQLPDIARLSIIASFFIAHTYYWGDVHLGNFGSERAGAISPVKSAIKDGACYTFHQDTPVIRPNMLETVWCAVSRTSKNGVVLGASERVTPLEALKGVTINAAYQYGEADRKGSLKEGKMANLIILDQNPLRVNPEEIRNIRILETIREGETVYHS